MPAAGVVPAAGAVLAAGVAEATPTDSKIKRHAAARTQVPGDRSFVARSSRVQYAFSAEAVMAMYSFATSH